MVTSKVNDDENLGRCCFDTNDAERNNPRTRFIQRSFVDGRMSVDRLTLADVQQLNGIHGDEARRRDPPRIFQGWYVFLAANASVSRLGYYT